MPMFWSLPVTVPTRVHCGRSSGGSFGGGGSAFATGTATAGSGGLRDGEKIGRSRVLDKVTRGIAHIGLALGARSGSACLGRGELDATEVEAASEFHREGVADVSARCSTKVSMSESPIGTAAVEPGMVSAQANNNTNSVVRLCIVLRAVI
jgi:hypothetical protein